MKNLLIPVLVILVLAIGYVFLKQNETPIVQNQADTVILSASFRCQDSSDFIAEFPDETSVKITHGKDTQTLLLIVGEGKKFENTDAVYIFAGEEATIINKVDTKTTTCEQTSVTKSAPVNFGDTAEGAGKQQDAVAIVADAIIGKWQSTTDTKFTREFKKDGTIIDSYEGGEETKGKWQSYSKENPISVYFPLEEDALYIQIILEKDNSALDFKIGKVTPEGLDLIYMARGKTLSFTSVK